MLLFRAIYLYPSSPAPEGRVGDPPRSREMPIRPRRPGHDGEIMIWDLGMTEIREGPWDDGN